MKKVKLNSLEKKIGKKLKKNTIGIGFDVASKNTGIAVLRTYKKSLKIIKTHKIENVVKTLKGDLERGMRYYIGELNSFMFGLDLRKNTVVAIENPPYMKGNPNTLKKLQTFAILTWREIDHLVDYSFFIYPISWRSQSGLYIYRKKQDYPKKTKIKQITKDYVNYLLNTGFEDEDICDALGLAIAGLLKKEKNE